jgi:hypothetical protein
MSFEQLKLEEAYFVELHLKGASQMRQVRDVMRENLKTYADGQQPEWVPVAMRMTFAEAKEALAGVRRELRGTKGAGSADSHSLADAEGGGE